MKSYTDISQSKTLSKILPLESADMYYDDIIDRITGELFIPDDGSTINVGKGTGGSIAAWSLAALLEEIPSTVVNNVGEDLRLHIDKDNLQYFLFYENEYTGDMFEVETELYDDMVDACVAMIERLHELNLL